MTGPAVVLSRRVRSRSEPLLPGSIMLSRLVLTAKPTRTLCAHPSPFPGISENLQDVSDSRKTAVINNELLRLNVDIATLQETRLADSGVLKEKDYTFYWQGIQHLLITL